jgi:mRNA interferase RelE/StbE
MYEIELSNKAYKFLSKSKVESLPLIKKKILSLMDEPRPVGCEKLKSTNYYRIRQGDFRIIYEINDSHKKVTIVSIGHRKEVYRNF